jgi:hypothetical protein
MQPQFGRPCAFAGKHVAQHVHAWAPKLFACRAAVAVPLELNDLAITRPPNAGDRRRPYGDGAPSRHGAERPHGRGALRRDGRLGHRIYVGEITDPGECVRLNIELIGRHRQARG